MDGMVRILFGIFIILHGLVHLFYFGQSMRYFELSPEFVWPDGGWAFGKLLSVENNRMLAGILLVIGTVIFLLGGIVFFLHQPWWRTVVITASAFSSIIFVLFWDGQAKMLSEKGFIGILINLALLAALLIFHWPGT
jgi:hypothetical protein